MARVIPKKRTPTIATVKSRISGCCAARLMR